MIFHKTITIRYNDSSHTKDSSTNFLLMLLSFKELLIDGLGRASPIEDPEACVYGYGAVRFLANASVTANIPAGKDSKLSEKLNTKGHKSLAQRLVRHGVVPLMILHLQVINEAVSWSHFKIKCENIRKMLKKRGTNGQGFNNGFVLSHNVTNFMTPYIPKGHNEQPNRPATSRPFSTIRSTANSGQNPNE